MPRAPRIQIEGGLYHAYNRFARGGGVIADSEEAILLLDLLKEFKPANGRAYVDAFGRSTGLERKRLDAVEFTELACTGLEIRLGPLAGRFKDRKTTTFCH